jgi:crossover junction endodeoxyribonuclease RuvC
MKILGIDPGSGIIGFGVIQKTSRKPKMLDAGVIRTTIGEQTAKRLLEAYEGMKEIIAQTNPDVAAVEKLFFSQNVTTGMKVSQSRGVILLALAEAGIPIYEYAPNEIKMAMTGYGHAKKAQIQEMVKVQLGLKKRPQDDAADALAVALTHLGQPDFLLDNKRS